MKRLIITVLILTLGSCVVGRVNFNPAGDPKGCIQPGPCEYIPEIIIIQDAGPDADYYPESF